MRQQGVKRAINRAGGVVTLLRGCAGRPHVAPDTSASGRRGEHMPRHDPAGRPESLHCSSRGEGV